jgi:hypothetical protein
VCLTLSAEAPLGPLGHKMVAVQVLITLVRSGGLSSVFWSSLQCCVWLYLIRPCSLRSGLKPSLLLVLLSYLWLWREIPSRYGRLDYCGFCFSSASALKSFWCPTIEQIVKHMGWSHNSGFEWILFALLIAPCLIRSLSSRLGSEGFF